MFAGSDFDGEVREGILGILYTAVVGEESSRGNELTESMRK